MLRIASIDRQFHSPTVKPQLLKKWREHPSCTCLPERDSGRAVIILKSEFSRNVYGMNHYRVNFSSKLNNGWADVEVSAGTTAGAIAQIRALYPDASAISTSQLSQSSAQKAADESSRRAKAQED
jgi:hypothetical protein